MATGEAGDADELINLYDAFGHEREGLEPDFGFSVLVRHRGRSLLFDGGARAERLVGNAEALGIDLRDVDLAVGSHAHADHLGGLDHLLEARPDVPLFLPDDFQVGAPLPYELGGTEPGIVDELPPEQRYFGGHVQRTVIRSTGRFRCRSVHFVKESRELAPGLTLIHTRSEVKGYLTRPTPTSTETHFTGMPELSLALETPAGTVLLVGCSHSGLEAIVRATRERLRGAIALLMGGFHLMAWPRDELMALAVRLRDEHGVAEVAPAHCSGHLAFKLFREVFGERYRAAGLGSRLMLDR
jgi:7,8-dihydropterin-6-yl-methyl-4-(beta-D-ribofuranosyl)aminobenzene 5'-phosphate synthase